MSGHMHTHKQKPMQMCTGNYRHLQSHANLLMPSGNKKPNLLEAASLFK